MLQQTQVSRVLPKYSEFLAEFPSVEALASAKTAQVLKAWKGMGYNRRALYLKKTAEAVTRDYRGKFPKNETQLTKLPGLGKYTARALMVFAYRQEVGAVDTNIRKIITHFFYKDVPQTEKEIDDTAQKLVPRGRSWEWHQALMDFGALELPKLIQRSAGVAKQAIPFRQSNRFFRGRIIDALRSKPVEESALISEMTLAYDRTEEFMRSILGGLEKDGLVVRVNGIIALPD